MGNETAKTNDAPKKKGFFKGIKSEFKRIIWPTREDVTKETIAVIVVTVILALIIAGLDFAIQLGLDAVLH